MNSYFRVRLSLVPHVLEDDITSLSFDNGASGVTEALTFAQPDLCYEPDVVPTRSHELDVFFPEKPQDKFFAGLTELNANIRWNLFEEENKDWLAEWKKSFKPFQLVGPFWIIPSWLQPPPECELPIYIDPGMAFGTGTHATTKMASYFVHKLSEKHKKDLPNWSLLDVGTGTAILAMLAARSGFGLVTGIEIDPEARRVAKENIKLNHLEEIEISEALIEEIHGQYDVVIANIIDGVLINIKKDLLRILKPGGFLFLTGILTERDDFFFEKFIDSSKLKVLRRLEKDEWVGYWVQKPETSIEEEEA
jgi:ribosomal protein L11 methyltransferase